MRGGKTFHCVQLIQWDFFSSSRPIKLSNKKGNTYSKYPDSNIVSAQIWPTIWYALNPHVLYQMWPGSGPTLCCCLGMHISNQNFIQKKSRSHVCLFYCFAWFCFWQHWPLSLFIRLTSLSMWKPNSTAKSAMFYRASLKL